MNDKEKQIEEITKTMCEDYGTAICQYGCKIGGDYANSYLSKKLYEAGYRKASDVIDEFMERLKQGEESVKIGNEWGAVVRDVDIERIAAEMRQEVK